MDETSLKSMFLQLLGVQGDQPLDCVGTPDELRSSLQQAYSMDIFKNSALMKVAESLDVVNEGYNPQKPIQKLLMLSGEHVFPETISELLLQQIQKDLS